jgi:hypothetical protein
MLENSGLWLHDALCLADYKFSDAFMQSLAKELQECDVLVASHPYLAEIAFPRAAENTLCVYEGYNVEYDIKLDYFQGSLNPQITDRLLEAVHRGESFASRHAGLVTMVSHKDKQRIATLYNIEEAKIIIVPNGSVIRSSNLTEPEDRLVVRSALRCESELIGIFLGSSFAANVESYRQGRGMLEAAGFTGTMLLVGSISQAFRDDWPPVNFREIWLGFVTDEVRDVLLSTADFALHLIFSGAGTNLKLFDYMSAGVPIIANNFGRRGVDRGDWSSPGDSVEELSFSLHRMRNNPSEILRLSNTAREIAKDNFDWSSIASKFEKAIMKNHSG